MTECHIIFFDHEVKTQIGLADSASNTYNQIVKSLAKSRSKPRIVLYLPTGDQMRTSYSEFLYKYLKTKSCKIAFLFAITNKSTLEFKPDASIEEEAEVSLNSLCSLFPDLRTKQNIMYALYLCCVLKYIQSNYYKSLHFIKSCYQKINYIPFLTSLYRIYKNKFTKLDLFTILSYVLHHTPELINLIDFFSALSTLNFKGQNILFKDAVDTENNVFKHYIQNPKPPQKYDYSDDVPKCIKYWGIFQLCSLQDLKGRDYWTIIQYQSVLIAMADPSDPKLIKCYNPIEPEVTEIKPTSIEGTNETLSLTNSMKDISNIFSQYTAAIIDYSASMIGCFGEASIRRSVVATEIINSFVSIGHELNVLDPFYVLDFQCKETDSPIKYNSQDFMKPSRIYDRICKAIKFLRDIKSSGEEKRVLVITDGFNSVSQLDKYKIHQKLIQNHIVLDVILLKEGESMKDICVISQLSGGRYYMPKTVKDYNFILGLEEFLDVSKRNIRVADLCEYSEEAINKLTEHFNYVDEIDSLRINASPDFYNNEKLLYSPFSHVDDFVTLRSKIIQKQIDICASYAENSNNAFFRIFRVWDNKAKAIDPNNIMVFLKGKDSKNKKIIYQVMITFNRNYPFVAPFATLKSNSKIEGFPFGEKIPLRDNYQPDTPLLRILKDLSKKMICTRDPLIKNTRLDPTDSLDCLPLKFTIYMVNPKRDVFVDKKHFSE